ncbi:TraB/GumN family protein [uncultured Maricaulis sp.]|uniref:TraB/GumN family protein n=1 Tax=uncultured Maricaulis sp. TaxID=174710 RepID=UPI0030D730DB|tara:strand:- start:35493 stop:36434 length:942 start_codon:yes stop_codon:yes gene_type:complete
MTRQTKFLHRLASTCGAIFAATGLAMSAAAGASHAQLADYSDLEASPALWHMSDADSDIYLFGTFHLLPPSLDWQTGELRAHLASADSLYLEADVQGEGAQARVQALVVQLGLNPQGVTLSSLLDAEAIALLASVAPSVGATPQMLEPMRPWLAQIVLSVAQMQALGLDPEAGVEKALLTAIAGSDVEIGYFETAEQQVRVLADLPDEVQVRGFTEGLREMERTPALLDDMVRAWAAGDVDAIDRIVNAEMREGAPEMYQALIVQRNHDWVPQIQELLDGEGTVFVAVGAAHLSGENGVVELLRDSGIIVERQ